MYASTRRALLSASSDSRGTIRKPITWKCLRTGNICALKLHNALCYGMPKMCTCTLFCAEVQVDLTMGNLSCSTRAHKCKTERQLVWNIVAPTGMRCNYMDCLLVDIVHMDNVLLENM